jgi:hypothetical protein
MVPVHRSARITEGSNFNACSEISRIIVSYMYTFAFLLLTVVSERYITWALPPSLHSELRHGKAGKELGKVMKDLRCSFGYPASIRIHVRRGHLQMSRSTWTSDKWVERRKCIGVSFFFNPTRKRENGTTRPTHPLVLVITTHSIGRSHLSIPI